MQDSSDAAKYNSILPRKGSALPIGSPVTNRVEHGEITWNPYRRFHVRKASVLMDPGAVIT